MSKGEITHCKQILLLSQRYPELSAVELQHRKRIMTCTHSFYCPTIELSQFGKLLLFNKTNLIIVWCLTPLSDGPFILTPASQS